MIKVLLVEDNREISINIQEFFKEDIDLNAVYNGNDALFNLANDYLTKHFLMEELKASIKDSLIN